MAANASVGLVVCSGDTGALCTATFSNVTVIAGGGTMLPAGTGASATTIVLDDFEGGSFQMGGSTDAKTPLMVTRVPSPPGGNSGSALRVAWPEQHGKWVEAWYAKREVIPQLTATSACTVRFKLWVEANAGISFIGIRFQDAKDEHFQWRGTIPNPHQRGWREMVIPIVLDGSAGHWGGDGKLDFPL